jgi:hypothetical protein
VEGLEVTFTIIGVIALAFGGGMALWRVSMLLGWKKQRASVVGYSTQRASRRSQAVCLTVRIPSEESDPVEAKDRGVWNRYSEGQEVLVLVEPGSDPPRVVAPEFLRFWMMSLIFIPFGAVFLYVALVYVPSLPTP